MTCELWRFNLQLFAEEKTEEATPHRREEARRKGQVARSTDLNAAVGMTALILLLLMLWPEIFRQISRVMVWLFAGMLSNPYTLGDLHYIFTTVVLVFLKLMAPVFLVALAAGMAVNYAQVGFLVSPDPIKFKLNHLNPIEGIKRILSKRALVEMTKALSKVAIVGLVTFLIVKSGFSELLFLSEMGLQKGTSTVAALVFHVALGAVSVFFLVAVLDLLFQRREYRERLKMSKQEVKEEYKQMEGDPLIRAKIREKQRRLAAKRMIASVPEATVVVTNPTHLAVALKYVEKEMAAPTVVAKGAGDIALRIAEVARSHQVPVVENKPVAQFLYKSVEIDQEIPPELYQAVAEILAMLYKIKK
ncbi:MAG: flagellar biosynthesis protein FlhB [Bacillota bacterium]